MEVNAPPLALATLKGAIKEYHDITCFDFNLYINEKIQFNELNSYLYGRVGSFAKFYVKFKLERIIKKFFKNTSYDVIGISILSQWQEPIAEIVIPIIKKYTKSKIVVGGPFFVYLNQQNFNKDFYKKYVDSYIVGDAEISFKEYLDDNLNYPGINNHNWDVNFDKNSISFPDYDDFDLTKYTEIQVAQSKGCVRKCAFCTVPSVWPKYVYKSPERMSEEIKYIYDNYLKNMNTSYKKIFFVDSLLNGSKKLLLETSHNLIKYFGKNHNKFYWGGQAIATSEKHIPPQAYKIASQAGLKYLIIGVESGSEKVRWEMNKKFYDKDLLYMLDTCANYNIHVSPLMIIGYPTETEEDFKKTLNLLETFKSYNIHDISPDNTSIMTLGPNMEITIDPKKYKIKNIKNNWNWESEYHNLDERVNRIRRYAKKAQELGLSNLEPEDFVNQAIPGYKDGYNFERMIMAT